MDVAKSRVERCQIVGLALNWDIAPELALVAHPIGSQVPVELCPLVLAHFQVVFVLIRESQRVRHFHIPNRGVLDEAS
jgi:hypothetical protein